MTDLSVRLGHLRRPRLLVRAARFGLSEYNRARVLRRLTGRDEAPSPARAVPILLEAEAQAEDRRRAGDATYSPGRHVELLSALMAEARALGV